MTTRSIPMTILKKSYCFVVLLLFCIPALSEQHEFSHLIQKSKQNLEAFKQLQKLSAEYKISDYAHQKINESKVTLSQIRADLDKGASSEINDLYDSIIDTLYPQEVSPEVITFNKSGTNDGVIRGRVLDFVSELPVSSTRVYLYDLSGQFIRDYRTDVVGRFVFAGLSQGGYILIADSSQTGYITTAQPDIVCPGGLGSGCQVEDLPLVNLKQGEILENINIRLKIVPRITGFIRDSENTKLGIGAASIKLYNHDGNFVKETFSDSFGHDLGEYFLAVPDVGRYYIVVSHSEYNTQLYQNITCSSTCDFDSGTPLNISSGENIFDFDFFMNKNAGINGSSLDSETLLPLNNGKVAFLNDASEVVASVDVDENGNWSAESLPMGEYKILAYESDGYLASLYDQHWCESFYGNCDEVIDASQTINHTDEVINGLSLMSKKGSAIRGRVTNKFGIPIADARIYLFDENKRRISLERVYTDEDGFYETYVVNYGSYYLTASASSYQRGLYPNINCEFLACDFQDGTAIVINDSSDIENINFELSQFASITGKVVSSNGPVQNKLVFARGLSFSYFQSAWTNEAGEYTINFLAENDYEIYVNVRGHYPEIYNNIHCDDHECINESSTPISVVDSLEEGFDFLIDPLEHVTFDLISNSINPIDSGAIFVYDSDGTFLDSYGINNVMLPSGEYYFIYVGNRTFVNHIYGAGNCESDCDASIGTLVKIEESSDLALTMYIDEYFYFDFDQNVTFDIYNEALELEYSDFIFSGKEHVKIIGNKYLKLSQYGNYPQIYDGHNCLANECDISQGTLISLQYNASLAIELDLIEAPIETISGTIRNTMGDPINNMRVDLLTKRPFSSNDLKTTYTDENGDYTFSHFRDGVHRVKVNPGITSPYLTTFYGDVSCHVNCQNIGTPIVLDLGQSVSGIDVNLGLKGTVSGENVLDIDGHPIQTKIYIFEEGVYDSDEYIRSVNVDENGNFEPIGLNPGQYKIVAESHFSNNPNFNNPSVYSAYPNITCPYFSLAQCAQHSESFDISNGQNITLDGFVVHRYGEIKGVISDASTKNPISDTKVLLFRADDGHFYRSFNFNEFSGEYSVKIDRGDYYLMYSANQSGDDFGNHIMQLFDGIDCPRGVGTDCFLTSGQIITVTDDEIIELDIFLTAKPQVVVELVNTVTNELIEPRQIRVYDENGNIVPIINYVSNIGNQLYILNLFPETPYTFRYNDHHSGYRVTSYPGVFCEHSPPFNCEEQPSQAVILKSDSINHITIRTVLNEGVNGFVKDEHTGEPIENVFIDFWDENGIYKRSTSTASNGGFSMPLYEDNYFISTDTRNQYMNEVFRDIPCPLPAIIGSCSVLDGEMVTLPINNNNPIIIDFNLTLDFIFSNGYEMP